MALQWKKSVVDFIMKTLPGVLCRCVSFLLLRNALNWIHEDLRVAERRRHEWSFDSEHAKKHIQLLHGQTWRVVHSFTSIFFNFPFKRTTAERSYQISLKCFCLEFTSPRSVGKISFLGHEESEIDSQLISIMFKVYMRAVHEELQLGMTRFG